MKQRAAFLFSFILCMGMACLGSAQESRKPFAIGHRGMAKSYPENTLLAMRACVSKGMGIEFDVRTSKDGVLVVIHDDHTKRTTNGGDRLVQDLSSAEIQALDAGSWMNKLFKDEKVPTLDELLWLVRHEQVGKVPLAVNVKSVDEAGEKQLVHSFKKHGLLEQAFFFDQDEASSKRLKALDPQVKIGKNIWKTKLEEEVNAGLVDVFLIGFVPTQEQAQYLRNHGKGIVVNKGGARENGDRPEAWLDYLNADIDGILVDHVKEFHQYIQYMP